VTERVPLPELYRSTRTRLRAFVEDERISDDRAVPATPGWSVHDVIAHLTGVAQDLAAGVPLSGGPTDEWTAGHVQRGHGVPTGELLAEWERTAPAVEAILAQSPIWPVVLDAAAHEYDIRGAVGDTSERDGSIVHIGATVMLKGLQVPHPLIIETEHREVRVGPGDNAASVAEPDRLVTTDFEAFRWRLGRRSRHQLGAMRWSGDPAPYVDRLCIFGPAQRDLVE
jgi:hypothetical protein